MMKKKIIPVILAAGVLVLPVLFTGCGLFGFTRDENLKALKGRWYDVNGDTTLDFRGNQMTISYGDRYKEGYRVRVTDTPIKYVERAAEDKYGSRDFEGISRIEIMEEGRVLTAYEQILDADGHRYRFVREEDLEKEKAVEDVSKDLPKTIESDVIEEFSLNFSLEDTRFDVPADTEWYSGHYSIVVDRKDDGCHIDFDAMGESYVIYRYEGAVSEEYVRGLATLIQDEKIPEHNGMYLRNNENFDSWSLNVKYESGEKLSLTASGRPATECPFSIYEFLKYADKAVGYMEEYGDPATAVETDEPETAAGTETETEETTAEPESGAGEDDTDEILAKVRGHWVDLNGETTLDFDGNRMTLCLYGGDAEEYEVRVGGSEYYRTIENAGGGYDTGFMIMSEIRVNDDGTLTAYEMIMDADGHDFRFVREEDLEKERAVEDLSENLPKVIESDELEEFSLHFSLESSLFDLPQDGSWPAAIYNFEITRNGDEYEMSFRASGDMYILCDYSESVSEEYVRGLAALIQDEKIPEHNGLFLQNKEDFDGWSLYAEYASGESLSLNCIGRPALECPFSIKAFLDYADQLVDMEN